MGDSRSSPAASVHRPLWATALSLACVAAVAFLVLRDLFVPEIRNVEVWLGFELRGPLAWATAPLHWAIFGVGAWGYWYCRPWIWPWASIYALYIAVSHLIWNLVSSAGGGLEAGLIQLGVFSVPALALVWARPPTGVGQ